MLSLDFALQDFYESIVSNIQPYQPRRPSAVEESAAAAEAEMTDEDQDDAPLPQEILPQEILAPESLAPENAADENVAGANEPDVTSLPQSEEGRAVLHHGHFAGRAYAIYDDGSVEIETPSGVQKYPNYEALEMAAVRRPTRRKSPIPRRIQKSRREGGRTLAPTSVVKSLGGLFSALCRAFQPLYSAALTPCDTGRAGIALSFVLSARAAFSLNASQSASAIPVQPRD